jgi:hypothetical protein
MGHKLLTIGRWTFAGHCLLWAASTASAGELPRDWNDIRVAGMGGSATAASIDESAPFYNPAGLGRIRNPRSREFLHILSVPGLMIGGNSMALKGINAAIFSDAEVPKSTSAAADAPTDYLDKDRFGRVLSKAVENPGDPMYGEVQLFPVGVMGSRGQATWIVGMPMRSEFTLGVIDKNDTSKAYINSKTAIGALVGLGNTSRTGTLSYGVSVRPNYRYSYEDYEYSTSQGSFAKFKNTVRTKGNTTTGFQTDVGAMFILPDYWFPTVGVAIRNIPTGCVDKYKNPVTGKSYTMCGSLRTGDTKGNTADAVDPTEVRAGVSITPRIRSGGARINFRLSVDAYPLPIQYQGNNYGFTDLNINDILHAGAELFFGNPLGTQSVAVRAGTYGSDMSIGASVKLFFVELEYATYPGYAALPGASTKRDRRHLIGLSTRW